MKKSFYRAMFIKGRLEWEGAGGREGVQEGRLWRDSWLLTLSLGLWSVVKCLCRMNFKPNSIQSSGNFNVACFMHSHKCEARPCGSLVMRS